MSELAVRVSGRDPLLFGDGRPFAAELGALRAHTLGLPLPETLAGFLRTMTGAALGWSWDAEAAGRARALEVAGPLLVRDRMIVLPAPADALAVKSDGGADVVLSRLSPWQPPPGQASDLPAGLLPLQATTQAKPERGFSYWPYDTMTRWTESETGDDVAVPERLSGPDIEERVHVALGTRSDLGDAPEEARLFTTQGVAFGGCSRGEAFEYTEWSLLARITGNDAYPLSGLMPFGGEGRLAYVETIPLAHWPSPPQSLVDHASRTRRLRMLLVTPGLFGGGWKPGWLSEGWQGAAPGAPSVSLRLVSAAVPRRRAVSGWDYETGRPKAVRWLVPAGAVYFFEVLDGDAAELVSRLWLRSVSDDEQARRDGYSLPVWGIWQSEVRS